MGQKDAEDPVFQLVDLVVAKQNLAGQGDVSANEGVKGVARHLLGYLRHFRNVDDGLEGRRFEKANRVLGNIDSLVADALEVGAHLHDRRDQSEVGRKGLLQGQHLEAAVVDLHLEEIHGGVACDDGAGEFDPTLHEGHQRLLGLGFDQRSHVQEAVFESFEVGLEVVAFHYPNLPVM